MKKILSVFSGLVVFTASVFAGDSVVLASEMISAYKSGFYPGVVRYADKILSEEGNSVYKGKALVYKGESLFRMNRVKDSLTVLDDARVLVSDNNELLALCNFWTGRGLAALEKDNAALSYYFAAAKTAKASDNESCREIYASSLYYAGKSFRKTGEYKSGADCFEFVVENGRFFSVYEYEDSAVNLIECLNLSGQFKKALELAAQFEKVELSGDTSFRILLLEGEALEKTGNYPEAYKKYCSVLSDGPAFLQAFAMQKAYIVSSEHQAQVREEPGSVIAKAQSLSESNPLLVSQFWIRLAIDSFNSQNYEKSIQYFENAEKNGDLSAKQLALLYRTEIQFVTSKKAIKEKALDALENLKKGSEELKMDSSSPYDFDFKAACARYSGLCENWDESLLFSNAILEKNSGSNTAAVKNSVLKTAVYWGSLSQYSKNNFTEAVKLLEKYQYGENEFVLLKAKALAKTGKSSDADRLFYSLIQKEALNNDGRLDYTRTLLNAGHLISTVEQATAANGAEADYMKGLALFNRRKWDEASECFQKALKGTGLDSKYVNFSRFYLGYSNYQLGKYDDACKNLKAFVENDSSNGLVWDCYTTLSRSLVQTGDYPQGAQFAEKALYASRNEKEKQESVLLYAGIYSDSGKYDEALKILKNYTGTKTEFAYQCRYLTAQIFVLKKDYKMADKTYAAIASEKQAGVLAEEACYRRGELSYTTEQYEQAISLFEEYCKKYYGGQFYNAALYFTAASLEKTGKTDKAALYYQQIADSPEASTYRYNAEKQLVGLYSASKDYDAAISTGRKMIEQYGEQASKDGIPQLIKELSALNKGADSKYLAKEREFENNGALKTPEGRKTGTELAELYARGQNGAAKAEELALKLFNEQKKNEAESLYAGQNAQLLAQLYRNQGKNKASAEYYLQAAELERKAGKDEEAARSLYGAVEAFDASGLSGDAAQTAKLLKELYPSSSYNAAAEKIVK